MNTRQALAVDKIKRTQKPSLSIEGFKGVLDPHQMRNTAFAYTLERCIVADDPGLGKTVVACALMALLVNREKASRFMVICEGAAQRQWYDEIKKFTWFEPLVVRGAKRAKLWPTHSMYDVIVTSYELIHRDYGWYEKVAETVDCVIIDEASILKNSTIQTSKKVKNILRFNQRVVLLTATAFDKNLLQMHSLFEIIDPNVLGSTRQFMDRFCEIHWDTIYRKNKQGFPEQINVPRVIGYKDLDLFKRLISPYVIRHTSDEVQMPALRIVNKWLDMSSKQQKIYNELEEGLLRTIDGDDHITAATKFTRLIQSCDDPSIINDQYPDVSVKLDYLRSQLTGELSGHKVLIFSKFMQSIKKIRNLLNELGIGWVEWSGEISQVDREAAKKKYKEDPNCKVMILSLAGERGINLQSPYMICFDQVFNAQRMKQIQGRARRRDSEYDSVVVYNYITAGTVEEVMFNKIKDEGELYTEIMSDADKEIFEDLSPSQMKELLKQSKSNRKKQV